MLGLLLIYFIGKYYYDLADKYEKHKWGFAILGVGSYYMGTIIAGILFVVISEIWGLSFFDTASDLALNFMALPFGIIACVGLYYLLKSSWKRNWDEEDEEWD